MGVCVSTRQCVIPRGVHGREAGSEGGEMDATLAEGWVRGQWAVLRSLTVPVSNSGVIGHSNQARTTVLVKWISCHMDSMTPKRKLEWAGWHCAV